MSVDDHDRLMAYVLGLSHALNLAFFTALAASGELVPRLQTMSSTTFDAQLRVATLVAGDNPHLVLRHSDLERFRSGFAAGAARRHGAHRATRAEPRRSGFRRSDGGGPPLSREAHVTGRVGGTSGQGRPRPRAYAAAPPLGGADRGSSQERRSLAARPGARDGAARSRHSRCAARAPHDGLRDSYRLEASTLVSPIPITRSDACCRRWDRPRHRTATCSSSIPCTALRRRSLRAADLGSANSIARITRCCFRRRRSSRAWPCCR